MKVPDPTIMIPIWIIGYILLSCALLTCLSYLGSLTKQKR